MNIAELEFNIKHIEKYCNDNIFNIHDISIIDGRIIRLRNNSSVLHKEIILYIENRKGNIPHLNVIINSQHFKYKTKNKLEKYINSLMRDNKIKKILL
jgi:predicted  nucleic acid-binding Zn ribbon protein